MYILIINRMVIPLWEADALSKSFGTVVIRHQGGLRVAAVQIPRMQANYKACLQKLRVASTGFKRPMS